MADDAKILLKGSLTRRSKRSGSDAYQPRMMTALLFYSYATGTFSSRKIEAASYELVPMQYVAANQHPDQNTICSFRK